MPAIDEKVTRQARAAISQLLEERPEFRDSKSNQIHDLIPFLDIEEDSAEWLPSFNDNTRALSAIWHSVLKNEPEKPAPAPVPVQAKFAVSNGNTNNGNGVVKKPVSKAATPAPAPTPVAKAVTPAPKAEEVAPKPKQEKETRREEPPAPVATPIPVEAEVIEPVQYELVVRSGPPQVLEERSLQASRALAEQFAIVQYHEQMLEQSNRTLEELNESIARAKESQVNAAQAYANSLEDLARLMATSLGPKATDFSKLLARMVGGSQPGKK